MSKALDDVLIVDMTNAFWASLGVALLADFGARVVRVETSKAEREAPDDAPYDWRHELANRNKLSLSLDIETAEGRRVLDELIAKADVFVTDAAAPELESGRLTYAHIEPLKADIVYARGSGFGPVGPDAGLPALDELAAAHTGMMPILPQPGQPPVYPGSGQMYSSVMLAFGVMAALRHRHETGEGQAVDVSLLAGNMYGASLDLQAFLAIGGERFLHPVSRLDAGNPMSGTLYPTSDRRWVTLTMPDTDRWWPALAEVTGLDVSDGRFDSHEKRCEANRLELIGLLEEAFAKEPAAHWRSVFTERQMSADVIEGYEFPASDEGAYDNGYILNLEHAEHGPVRMIGFPIHMSHAPATLERTAPRPGADSAAVLREVLGHGEERIAELRSAGAIA